MPLRTIPHIPKIHIELYIILGDSLPEKINGNCITIVLHSAFCNHTTETQSAGTPWAMNYDFHPCFNVVLPVLHIGIPKMKQLQQQMGNTCRQPTNDLKRTYRFETPQQKPQPSDADTRNEFSIKHLNEYYSRKPSQPKYQPSSQSGYGKLNWDDGASYIGFLQNGIADGSGVFIYPDGSMYTGQFKQGEAHGKGTYKTKEGNEYQGDWVHNQREGRGEERFGDGSGYEGEFHNSQKYGQGSYTFANGNVYTGLWRRNKMNGEGVFRYIDGGVYTGGWADNLKHGAGKYEWLDGKVYEGEYQYDKKHGFGTYTWTNGMKYTGYWVNGMRHGRGTIENQGQSREGAWEKDNLLYWYDDTAPQASHVSVS